MHIGLDIGGTHMRGIALPSKKISRVAIRHAMRLAVRQSIPKSKKAFEAALGRLIIKISGDKKIQGIGVGLPGVLDYKRGVLVASGNIPYLKNWNAKKFFSRFRVLVRLDNDSRCFVRAEAKSGAGIGYKNIVGLAIGTGIGGAVIEEGKMHYGVHGREGEVGHMVLSTIHDSRITKQTFQDLGAKEAFKKHGNRSKIIGIGVANVIHAFDPEVVILGGGGGLSKNMNLNVVKKTANSYLRSPLRGKTKIVKGALGEYAGAIGAAMLLAEKRSR